ncbi:MAG: aminotransferase class V-fold PLP-dependent enzyme [Dehalococcoidia bacterium]
MGPGTNPDILGELGVKRVINALGSATVLGGSVLQPRIQEAMEEANRTFVSMEELLEKAGRSIADLLGVEAAFVTSGCFAALALSAAAIMTGSDQETRARLPDTTGLSNQFLIQSRMRYHYDRCVTVPGGRLREVGNERGTTADQLAAAIGPSTAGILYPAHLEGTEGTLPLADVVAIARDRNIPVLVDAAYQVYPLERMKGVVQSGADSVCFSAKYMGGPNSAGFLCGKKPLVEAAALNAFIAYEMEDNNCFGRGFKVDRQEVVATVVVLREWFKLDHRERLRVQEMRFQVIVEALGGLPHVQTEQVWEKTLPWMTLNITLDENALGKTAAGVEQALRSGDPAIWLRADGNTLHMASHTLNPGEEHIVAERLREALRD